MNNKERQLKASLEFVNKANVVHNNFYKDGYSEVEYKTGKDKVEIICPDHGSFWQRASSHLGGNGCPACSEIIKINSGKKSGEEKRLKAALEFVAKANVMHNHFYNYDKVIYKKSREKVEIICPDHGSFWQKASSHLSGNGCQLCGDVVSEINRRKIAKKKILKASLEFVAKANVVHNHFYNYDKVIYKKSREKVEIVCPIEGHGSFWQRVSHHLTGTGCPICNYSHGEREIWKFLKGTGIDFIPQHIYEDCRGDYNELPFDFYIPSINLLIEYDGEQHFKYIEGMQKAKWKFEQTQRYDKIKNEYALNKGIELIRIRYDEDLEVALSKLRD